jgi:rhodanese-related sulfurtransferase
MPRGVDAAAGFHVSWALPDPTGRWERTSMTRLLKPLAMLLLAVALVPGGGAWAAHLAGHVEISDIVAGDGAQAVRHARVTVHYTGWLADGTKFDSSLDRETPFSFTIGGGQVIPGWEIGITGMRTGGKRELVIPPGLAYGGKGAGSVIPPDATLRFEVELVAVTPPKYANVDNAALRTLIEKGTKIVDLRRQDEWDQTGVIEGSERLTAFDASGRFKRRFPDAFQRLVKPDEEVILICRQGNRSSVIANMLAEQAGYTKVYNVTEGIERWIKDGNPVVR